MNKNKYLCDAQVLVYYTDYTGLTRPFPSVYITGAMPVRSMSMSSLLTSYSARVNTGQSRKP